MGEKISLELLGEVCPVPLLKTEDKVKNLDDGSRLFIKVDHTQAVRNLMDWCEEKDYIFEVDELAPGIWELKVTKGN
ncbi:sulfurtransferase TusA family protein [Selenihalanaerobacter shriftii]|uniref:TusA-related sulfurtransferase n=1 Tax=Selenihalanaerobacter shriftii TaxID=142842 RepID=A0A1T4JUA5_9FIRM|nr:sulfurtransferase TusA family protein [Selenihalanaerobacter shriftii]SJZ33802.1 TusA-related sulfurtransferase [Selenihalanaerobacter shriftii]